MYEYHNQESLRTIETDASNLVYGGILMQRNFIDSAKKLVRFTLRIWNDTKNYFSTIRKEILAILICIGDDLINKKIY